MISSETRGKTDRGLLLGNGWTSVNGCEQLLSVSLVLYVLIITSIIIFLSFFVLLNCLYFNPQFLLFFFLPILSPNPLGEDGLS